MCRAVPCSERTHARKSHTPLERTLVWATRCPAAALLSNSECLGMLSRRPALQDTQRRPVMARLSKQWREMVVVVTISSTSKGKASQTQWAFTHHSQGYE
jgi:hypothetical protein